METYFGLVRGINVGGKNRLKMADLKKLLEDFGLLQVKTLLQSGNFVFRSKEVSTDSLAVALESATRRLLGLDVLFFVRPKHFLNWIVHSNPFPLATEEDPSRLMLFLSKEPIAEHELQSAKGRYPGTERFEFVDGVLFVFAPDGIGTSKLLNSLAWTRQTARATARNWNTVLALVELAESLT